MFFTISYQWNEFKGTRKFLDWLSVLYVPQSRRYRKSYPTVRVVILATTGITLLK